MSRHIGNATPQPVGRIAVTGGSNGIGRAIVRRLIEDGHRVVNLDRVAEEAVTGASPPAGVVGDLGPREALVEARQGADLDHSAYFLWLSQRGQAEG